MLSDRDEERLEKEHYYWCVTKGVPGEFCQGLGSLRCKRCPGEDAEEGLCYVSLEFWREARAGGGNWGAIALQTVFKALEIDKCREKKRMGN